MNTDAAAPFVGKVVEGAILGAYSFDRYKSEKAGLDKIQLSIAALKPPFNIAGMEPRMDPVPAVGEHTCAILEELGYSAAEIGRLKREKAI